MIGWLLISLGAVVVVVVPLSPPFFVALSAHVTFVNAYLPPCHLAKTSCK